MKRLALAAAGIVVAVALVAAVVGAAASLLVTSAKVTTFTATGPTTVPSDTTAPTKTAMSFSDTNGNGKVDRVTATFNENLVCDAPCTAPWTLVGVPSGGSLSSVTVSNAVATLTLTEGAGAASTGVGSFTVALAAQATGVRDAAGNRSSFAATAPSDQAAPVLSTLELFDTGATPNGKVDQVKATFSETLAASTLSTAWTLTNVPSGGSLSSVSVSGAVATLTLAEGAGSVDTAVGSMTVALAANASGVRDTDGNQSSFAATAPVDKAVPVMTALELFDASGTSGKVDRVTATFTEALASTSLTTPWTLTNVPSGGSLSSVSVSGAVVTLTLAEGSGSFDTAVGSMKVALAANATGVRDAAGNQASFAATAPIDKARPIALTLGLANGGTASKPDQLDTITVTFSEPLNEMTVCSSKNDFADLGKNNSPLVVSIVDNGAPTTLFDRLDVSVGNTHCGGNLRFGSIDLGSSAYTTATYADTGINSSIVSLSGSSMVVRLGKTTATPATVSTTLTAIYTPHASLSDAAGNLVVGTASHTGNHF